MEHRKIGDKVKVAPHNDNDSYDEFRDKVLIITHIATDDSGHVGFDETMKGQALYDFETKDGTDIPFSLYDYEIEDYS